MQLLISVHLVAATISKMAGSSLGFDSHISNSPRSQKRNLTQLCPWTLQVYLPNDKVLRFLLRFYLATKLSCDLGKHKCRYSNQSNSIVKIAENLVNVYRHKMCIKQNVHKCRRSSKIIYHVCGKETTTFPNNAILPSAP